MDRPATTDQPFVDPGEAAAFLLAAVWKWEQENWKKTIFETVEDTGLIGADEVWDIGRKALRKN